MTPQARSVMPRRAAAILATVVVLAIGASADVSLTLTALGPYGSPMLENRAMALADMDGDGDNDVLVVNSSTSPFSSGNVVVMRNDGQGVLTQGNAYGTVNAGKKIVAADFNQDGKMDAAVCNFASISLFYGDGNAGLSHVGSFTLPTPPPPFPWFPSPPPPGTSDIAVADFNKDGYPDLAVAGVNGHTRVVFRSGSWYAWGGSLSGPFTATGIAAGDVNGDGNADIVVSASSQGMVRYLGNGSGGFGGPANYGGAGAQDVELGDINGDGKLDAVVIGDSFVQAHTNDGAGNFTSAATNNSVGGFRGALEIIDVTGDNTAEILVTNNIFKLSGSTLSHISPSPLPTAAWFVAAGQIKNGGLNDIVTGLPGWGMTVYINGADTDPPVIDAVADVTAEATSSDGATVTYTAPSATDNEDATITVNCSPASGSQFGLGETTVTCSASDAAGNDATTTFKVNVVDTTEPDLTLPADITAELTGPSGAAVTFADPTAFDLVGVTSGPSCDHASGSTFPLGETTVTCSASDAAGNEASGSFTVTVADTIAPSLSLPPDVTASQNACGGTAVSLGAASATDASGAVTITHNAPALYPLGTTIVTFTATDGSGNASSGEVSVTVNDTSAPSIDSAAPSQSIIWPPNNQMVSIDVSWSISDCDQNASCSIQSVSANEPAAGDFVIVDADTVQLRAKRLGKGSGRIYTIGIRCVDAAGNVSTRSVEVLVPHDQRK